MRYVVFAGPGSSLPALLAGHSIAVTSAVSRESVAMMLDADGVVVDASRGADASYVLGLLNGLHKRAVLVDREMTAESLAEALRDAAVPFADITRRSAPPLAGVIDAAAIDTAVRAYLDPRGIVAEPDLVRLNLDDLAASVPRPALTRFVRALARSERYPRAEELQEFLVRRGIFI